MNTYTPHPPMVTLWNRIHQPHRDLVIALIAIACVFFASAQLDLSEKFTHWALSHETLQLDEFPLVLFSAALVSIWFSRRRMREVMEQAHLRIAAERTSQQSQRMFKSLFDQGLCGNFVADFEGNILLCNSAFSSMCGRSEATLNLRQALGPQWDEYCTQLQQVGKIDIAELKVTRPDGAPWIVMARLTQVSDQAVAADQSPASDTPAPSTGGSNIHGFFADVTEQHLAERELAILFKENQSLARHAMRVQEEERRNIAREIHDEMGQYLTAIRLDVATLPKDKSAPHAAIALRISSHVEHIQQAVRGLIHKLRPTALDAHGLVEAVEQLVKDWKKQHPQVSFALSLDQSCQSMPEKTSIAAYRIVQESLTNIARHARAQHVSIKLMRTRGILADTLSIEIRDDGIGFNTYSPRAGFGVSGMRERIEAEGGVFTIQSQGKGVLVSASIPLQTALAVIQESN